MSRDTRRQANRRGHGAETLAGILLRVKGYRILARSYRVPAGEIDIIAGRGNVIQHPDLLGRDIRFDVIAVLPGKLPKHIIDAWQT